MFESNHSPTIYVAHLPDGRIEYGRYCICFDDGKFQPHKKIAGTGTAEQAENWINQNQLTAEGMRG